MTSLEALERTELVTRLDSAVTRATERLLALQCSGGQWQGLVEAAANLEAEYIFVHRLLGRPRPERERGAVERLLATQQADGGWSLAPGQPSHVSTTIEAYLALKLGGVGRDEPPLARARALVLAAGGLPSAGMFTRFWLA